MVSPDLIVLYEHPEWQKPLFAALTRRGVNFDSFDLKRASFDVDEGPKARVYFNQASPSAYLRGNPRAVPLALAFMRSMELQGAPVLNGARAFALELSKTEQSTLMKQLGIAHPKAMAFNDVEEVLTRWTQWPALLKPQQGGSGARMYLLHSPDELRRLLEMSPDLWLPDNLLLLQEYFEVDQSRGIVRMEFLGTRLLYAMRVISHGAFNLCPSEVCNPVDGGDSACLLPENPPAQPVEFFPYKEVPVEAVVAGRRIMEKGGLDVGGIEYLEAPDGRLIFYDVNANSNLRPAVAQAFDLDPFDEVVTYLQSRLSIATNGHMRPEGLEPPTF